MHVLVKAVNKVYKETDMIYLIVLFTLVWFFFTLEISESNLPILSIHIVLQNIENSRIRDYVKNELKFHGNFSYFDNGLTKNIF